MGVKSTIFLTREDAELKFLAHIQRQFRDLCDMSCSDLEDLLMHLDDQEAGGESFNNYQIVEHETPEI